MRFADKLSLSRIVFAPVFCVFYLLKNNIESLTLPILIGISFCLILIELTDYYDGYFARKYNQVSDTGKLLDPFADTVLHISIFFCFAYSRVMPSFIFLLIAWREFFMLFLRMVSCSKGFTIAARMGGKVKTVLYITSCFFALALDLYKTSGLAAFTGIVEPFNISLTVLFYLCAAASYISFIDYIVRFGSVLKSS